MTAAERAWVADRALAGAPGEGDRVYSKNSQRYGHVMKLSKSGTRAHVAWENTLGSYHVKSWVRLDNIRVV